MNRHSCPALRHLLSGLLLLAAAALAPAATNITLSYKFDGSTPLDPVTIKLYGSAQIRAGDNLLALTDQLNNQKGTFVIDALPTEQRLSSLQARFLIRLDKGNSAIPADGFSFNFGPELLPEAVGEDGITNGLAVTFDTFDNGGPDSAPAVEVLYDEQALAGATFSGRTRTAVWTNNTNGLTFSTGTGFVPVVVGLAPDPAGSGSLVSVTWNGSTILSGVPVPYTPAKGWRVAFGARTGGYFETHHLRDVELSGDTVVELRIRSEYGATQVDPPVGTSLRSPGANVILRAPEYIYLDRYRRELPNTPAAIGSLARYRARRVSPASGSTLTLEKDTTVTWQWEVENLAEVDSGTEGIAGLSPTDVTDPTHQDTLGRRYLAPNSTEFDSVVYNAIQAISQPVRFAASSYVLENAPASPERYLELSGEGDHLRADGTVPTAWSGADGSFTVEFWARRDPAATRTAQEQVVLGIGSQAGARQQIAVGFGTDRGVFVDNGQARVAAGAEWTDAAWHHWGVVNDAGAGRVRVYRDGTLVREAAPALAGYTGDGTLVIGGRAAGTNTGTFFGGGLNNLRLWRTALPRQDLQAARLTPSFSNSQPNLALELPFDAPPSTVRTNVLVSLFNGTNALSSVTDLNSYVLASNYFAGGFALPSTDSLPLVNQTYLLIRNDFTSTNGGGTVTNVNGPFQGPWTNNVANGWYTAGQGTNLGRSPSTFLTFPAITVTQASHVILSFQHDHSFETDVNGRVDGGQVRFSVNGGPFIAVPTNAFSQGGYNGTVQASGAQLLANQVAFTGSRGPYFSTADLGSFLAGDRVAVQFVAAFSPSNSSPVAWRISSLSLSNQLANNYHAWVFRSQLAIDTGGDYTFHLGSDDGSQLWVDGLLVVNNDGRHPSNNVSATVTLAAGLRPLEVRLFDAGGQRALSLQYQGPGVLRQDLPAGRLNVNASDLLAAGVVTNYSTEGRRLGFQARGFEGLFPPHSLASNLLAVVQPGFQFGLVQDAGATTVGLPANGKAPLNDWRRVFWSWNKQYQFQVRVSCGDPDGLSAVAALPYLVSPGHPTNAGGASLGPGIIVALSHWINEGEPLTVGTVYRTADRRYTLSSLSGNVNLFGSLSLDQLVDGNGNGQVSREYHFPAVGAPGELTFEFKRTVHRASLALGQALDVASLATINPSLYPELPAGGAPLLVNLNGPAAREEPRNAVQAANPGGSGSGWAWDFVGRRWFPTKPGVFTIDWSDLNGYTNTIEVTARFPTDPEERRGFTGWERKDGSRLGNPADLYSFTTNYPGVATNYPGAPLAHYAYGLPPGGTPPAVADLDPQPADRWFFKGFTHAEVNSAQVADARFFSDTREANRSVLVFSRRPNPNEAATGDPARETIVVRVAQAVVRTNQASALAGSRLESPEDRSGFHAGYVTTDSRNYNPTLHDRTAVPGQWGPVYPVNARFSDEFPLSVLWFYNTAAYGDQDPLTHQPGVTTVYTNVAWPDPHDPATPVIYLSSQLGSEGVGQAVATNDTPDYQDLLDPARVTDVAIYHQPVREAAGFNPNEEHAFLAPSKAYVLTGDPRFNLDQSAAFALQHRLNRTNLAAPAEYTSHPFVLVQYRVPGATNASDAAVMRAYAVQSVRSNATAQAFPRLHPATGTVRDANNQPVPQPANPLYDFHYTALAGDLVVPPYPLNLALGNVILTNTTGGNVAFVSAPGVTNVQRTLWEDKNGNRWVVSGGGRFFQRYWYPLQDGFWFGEERPPAGTPLAWDPENVDQGDLTAVRSPGTRAVAARYDTRWGKDYPVLKKGETLTYAGGEYKADHPASRGLPAVLNWASAELVYDSTTPSMILQRSNRLGGAGIQWIRRPGVRIRQQADTWYDWFIWSDLTNNSKWTSVATNLAGSFNLTSLPVRYGTNYYNDTSGNAPAKSPKRNQRYNLQADLLVETTGDYTFYVVSGGGSILSIGGQDYPTDTNHFNRQSAWGSLNNGTPSDFYYNYKNRYYRAYETNQITVPLNSGYHTIDITYVDELISFSDNAGVAKPKLEIEYAGPGIPRQPIPAGKLTLNPDDPLLPDAVRRDYLPLYPFTYSAARVTRPLDRLATPMAQAEMPETLTPRNPDAVLVSGSRWYFKGLSASLGQRFYYDTLAGELVFRGRLNDLESGAPDLTRQPVQAYVLEPNFLGEEDVETLLALARDNGEWTEAIERLHAAAGTEFTTGDEFGLGVVAANQRPGLAAVPFYAETNLAVQVRPGAGDVVPASSFGIGSALVATPHFLQSDPNGPVYLALAENNDPRASGAVALHLIQLSEERYRGSIQVLSPPDAFSEKINLKHTGDFGGNTAEIYYQWWVHDVAPLGQILSPDDPNAPTQSGWQIYRQGLGLNAIEFTGRPDITLADKLFFVRYGGKEELDEAAEGNDPDLGSVADASWRHVALDEPEPDWGPEDERVPFQWAGAANSPQRQADGSRRYLPQLVMGWVKRILDRINAYEARYSATFNGDAPATYSSMLMEAGGPYIGAVALNADKNSLENVGLIQLYETVLQRAKDLTAGANATAGTDQALLLAATRLASLYRLLGSEAYQDAQSTVVPQSPDLDDSAAASLFAFKNEVATSLEEQLALLRGTDFVKAYPSFNRLFWNYLKADGEAAYNAVYNIQDMNQDGLIDESDAALQYPMGHGDSWGHYLSALGMHYSLLRRPGFTWQARAELYSLLGNVLPVDYLDERSFAVAAAEKARAGLEIVQATYHQTYSADPDVQWQGYTDTADPARAWGMAEWSRRVGQGGLFDWMTANGITPAPGTNTAEGLDRIDRPSTTAEIASLAGALSELQSQLDLANRGQNPLGLDADAMAFDLDPFYDGVWWERVGQFQQVYDRAVAAARSAQAAASYARRADQQLRRIANDTRALQESALLQDLDFRNRLIQIYGTPYQGTIGPGQIFAEGYAGPDLVTYAYIDSAEAGDFLPRPVSGNQFYKAVIQASNAVSQGLDFSLKGNHGNTLPDYSQLFYDIYLKQKKGYPAIYLANTNTATNSGALVVNLPLVETANYALTAPPAWGQRTAPGEIQFALNDLLASQLAQEIAVEGYNDYVRGIGILAAALDQKLKAMDAAQQVNRWYYKRIIGIETSIKSIEGVVKLLREAVTPGVNDVIKVIETSIPKVVGLATDALAPARGAVEAAGSTVKHLIHAFTVAGELTVLGLEIGRLVVEQGHELDSETIQQFMELVEMVEHLADELKEEELKRLEVGAAFQRTRVAADRVRTLVAEGERLQQERIALNRQIAASAQRNRYADLVVRLTRNEAMRKYNAALVNALRYTWLAAQAYDYETSLSERHPAGIGSLLEEIVKTRRVGQWVDGEPRLGNEGLASILARLQANYQALQGQIGLNNAQFESSLFSLRTEAFRISTDQAWASALRAARVPDLWQVPEFRQYCRPFDHPTNGAQPGLVIEFSTEIQPGRNFFGRPLSALDHSFSGANFATKLREVAVAFPGYDQGSGQSLSLSPRVYLLPVGQDLQRCSDTQFPTVRSWNVVSQRIPAPYVLNEDNLRDPGFQPSSDGLDGSFVDRIRFGDFRAFTTDSALTPILDLAVPPAPPGWSLSARLYGRSVWNTRWLLIIPGATLSADKDGGLDRFIGTVTDIKLFLQTYSNMGM